MILSVTSSTNVLILIIWTAANYNCCFGCNLEWKPGYGKMDHSDDVVYAGDGTCGVWDSKANKYVKPNIGLLDWNAMKSINDFHNAVLGPLCGDPYYENFKKCAMVRILGNQMPSEYEWKEDKKDILLVFVDGCAICKNSDNKSKELLKLDLKFKYTWPDGSLFTSCKEEEHEAGTYHTDGADMQDVARMFPKAEYTKKASHGTSFVLNGLFYQRVCKGLFSQDDVETTFRKVKMTVEHNCGEGKAFAVELPDLVTADYQSHIVEMRGLWLDLATGTAKLLDRIEKDYVDHLSWNNWKDEPTNQQPKQGSSEEYEQEN